MALTSTGQPYPLQVRVSRDADLDVTPEIVSQDSTTLYGLTIYNSNGSGELYAKFYFTDSPATDGSEPPDLMISVPGSGSPTTKSLFITTSGTTQGITATNGLAMLGSDADGDAVGSSSISNFVVNVLHS